jgi:hypothetical protein
LECDYQGTAVKPGRVKGNICGSRRWFLVNNNSIFAANYAAMLVQLRLSINQVEQQGMYSYFLLDSALLLWFIGGLSAKVIWSEVLVDAEG